MKLYLIQHALAKSKEEDPERGLTDEGIASTKRISEYFGKMSPNIHVIWCSAKERARQTAKILAESLNIKDRILEHTGLAPNDVVENIMKKLEKIQRNNIAMVGHLPHLSRLASKLLTGSENLEVVQFINSGIACLERDESVWRVVWVITPDIIF